MLVSRWVCSSCEFEKTYLQASVNAILVCTQLPIHTSGSAVCDCKGNHFCSYFIIYRHKCMLWGVVFNSFFLFTADFGGKEEKKKHTNADMLPLLMLNVTNAVFSVVRIGMLFWYWWILGRGHTSEICQCVSLSILSFLVFSYVLRYCEICKVIEVCWIWRGCYHLKALAELASVFLHSPMLPSRPTDTYRSVMWKKAMSDELHYFGTLLITIDKGLCHWVRVECSDGCPTLILDVFCCLAHCL